MMVKICGLTLLDDALAARDAGADLLGFVFAPSPRRVTPEAAGAVIRALGSNVKSVGVFVDEDQANIRRVADIARLDYVQLHGGESPEFCAGLGLPVIKAVRVRDAASMDGTAVYGGIVRFLLLDAWHPECPGGTGAAFDWSLLREMPPLPAPWLLAGGLTPGNVSRAVSACRPDGVDVSGGVESRPGIKDHRLIRQFIEQAKGGHRVA